METTKDLLRYQLMQGDLIGYAKHVGASMSGLIEQIAAKWNRVEAWDGTPPPPSEREAMELFEAARRLVEGG